MCSCLYFFILLCPVSYFKPVNASSMWLFNGLYFRTFISRFLFDFVYSVLKFFLMLWSRNDLLYFIISLVIPSVCPMHQPLTSQQQRILSRVRTPRAGYSTVMNTHLPHTTSSFKSNVTKWKRPTTPAREEGRQGSSSVGKAY